MSGNPRTRLSAPNQQRLAPAQQAVEQGGQRPADGRCETRNQRNTGDRTARIAAIERAERRKGGVVESERHSDTENRPCGEKQNRPVRHCKCDEPSGEHDVGQHQHAASATSIDDPPDRRTGERCDQQSAREGSEDPRPGHADAGTDRAGKNGWQVVARSPGERLRQAKRADDKRT